MHLVKSTNDVLNLMKLGEMNHFVSSAALNNRSSCSHSILTDHVQGKDISGSIQRNCLHLVNLTGSDRVDKSEVTGDRLKKAQYINRSLSCLGDVITALAQKNSHIPYGNSKVESLKNALTSKEVQTAEPNKVKEVKPPPEKTPHALDDLALKVLLLSSQKLLQCAMLY
ncbi:hypothetical protein GIB67_002885 [Kingdonia uniflora]|uniref:Kinesin motor domain-containing protein n=1 Tax=Kingdonia uniflora TaxID=39325 RepID=A0A7J7NR51_9MAGN|nr:hypothetical protein GIB67_002885 [Kingdonia uniflora]